MYSQTVQLLMAAKWPTLFDRRIYLSVVECYKIVFGFYHLKLKTFSNSPQLSVRELIICTNFISNLPDSIVINILFY